MTCFLAPNLQIGISAPQGCGKTTLVEQLQELFNGNGTTAVSASVDDFYLTYKVCVIHARLLGAQSLLLCLGRCALWRVRFGVIMSFTAVRVPP